MPTSSDRTPIQLQLIPTLAAVFGATAASAETRVLVNPGDQGEQARGAVYAAWRGATEAALKNDKTSWVLSTSATEDLSATRTRVPDVIVAPAHIVGSAIRYGYMPVLGIDQPVQAVLVTAADSPIASLAQAGGKKIGMPLQDSIVTYLVRGEVNAANTTIKRQFASVYQTRYQDALLTCLQLRQCDVVAVERSVFERWSAAGEKVKVVMSSKSAPGLAVAVKDAGKTNVSSLRSELIKALAKSGSILANTKVATLAANDFEYVSTLGYFTPRELPGARMVDAETVATLLKQGAQFVDTRNAAEFKEGHVPGAKLVPYVEKSAKDADFDASLDKFDIEKLAADRASPLIFGCNGPECWKSFKASHAAVKAGYTQVYWFRGGLPEWRTAGLEVDTASGNQLAMVTSK